MRKNLSKKQEHLNELDAAVANSLYKWRVLDSKKRGKQARYQAQLTINKCKGILNGRSGDEQLLNKALVYGVFFRGLQDYNDLAVLTHLPDWNLQPELIERIWNLLCDCKDRMIFVSSYVKGRVFEMVVAELSRLDEEFKNLPKLYGSICFDAKKVTCSICKRDFRSCTHIRGHMYAGAICYATMNERERAVPEISLMNEPKDKRCRVWPWQMSTDGQFEGTFATRFRLDDFMRESQSDADWII